MGSIDCDSEVISDADNFTLPGENDVLATDDGNGSIISHCSKYTVEQGTCTQHNSNVCVDALTKATRPQTPGLSTSRYHRSLQQT